MRANRIGNCPLKEKEILLKQDRGVVDFKKDTTKNIIAANWHDNSVVSVASNTAGIYPLHDASRYSSKMNKKGSPFHSPHLIYLYNKNMGGVDRSDQNISLYRIAMRGTFY